MYPEPERSAGVRNSTPDSLLMVYRLRPSDRAAGEIEPAVRE